ncbi:metallophosphoesterase [Massilibacteroides sp.]|uniref:metallophosphoesterase n=1 Tax=Massilibacteroides sp. TaxID=2034766 RepID=UPI00261851B9|nr:metallophosphoesterase [Massilibacteroides sp.]MDD4514242.1 metallophosphoesterase [Massilibacteroides sp.]
MIKKFRECVLFAFAIVLSTCVQSLNAQKLSELPDNSFNFIIATDLGRNGYYDQKPIAHQMGETADQLGIEFVIASGDVFHYDGVQSVNDPLWMTNFESIYSHPELQVEWYPLLGNHEYRGNTQAVIDYSQVSRRWCMPDRYYTQSYDLENGATLRIVYIDTPSLIDKYRNGKKKYPDAGHQDMEKQLAWIDSTLNASTETWKIVVGHHPVFAETSKDENERTDMQARVAPLLKKYKVDYYICGHIHNFQHIRKDGFDTDFVVNTSASRSRKVKPIEGTVFCNPETGFSVMSATNKTLDLYLLNKNAEVLHKITRTKK